MMEMAAMMMLLVMMTTINNEEIRFSGTKKEKQGLDMKEKEGNLLESAWR